VRRDLLGKVQYPIDNDQDYLGKNVPQKLNRLFRSRVSSIIVLVLLSFTLRKIYFGYLELLLCHDLHQKSDSIDYRCVMRYTIAGFLGNFPQVDFRRWIDYLRK
jgi:hypothetical protein